MCFLPGCIDCWGLNILDFHDLLICDGVRHCRCLHTCLYLTCICIYVCISVLPLHLLLHLFLLFHPLFLPLPLQLSLLAPSPLPLVPSFLLSSLDPFSLSSILPLSLPFSYAWSYIFFFPLRMESWGRSSVPTSSLLWKENKPSPSSIIATQAPLTT